MDAALRARLLGRVAVPGVPASLAGYRRVRVRGRPYPTLIAAPACTVAGMACDGLTGSDHRLLVRYEGPEYRLLVCPVQIQGGDPRTARVFVTPPGLASDTDWQEPV